MLTAAPKPHVITVETAGQEIGATFTDFANALSFYLQYFNNPKTTKITWVTTL